MSTQASASLSPRVGRQATEAARTLFVAACAVLPILALCVLAARWSYRLQPLIPFEISNFEALRRVASMLLHSSGLGDDSWLPMQRAIDVLHGPHAGALYETLFFGDRVRFQYPPTSLLWLELLGAAGVSGPDALNALNGGILVLNAAAVALLAWLIFRPSGAGTVLAPDARLSPVGMSLLAGVSAVLFYPVIRAAALGQIQLWIDLFFTAALVLWGVNRRLLAGVLIGLACTIKPQLSLLLLWGVLWGEKRFAIGGLAALAAAGSASLLRYGLHNHLAYLQVLSFLSRHGESFFTNQSVNGILNAYLSGADPTRWSAQSFTPFHPAVYAGSLAASVAALAGIIAPPLLRRRSKATIEDLGSAAICCVIGAPVAWEHHYALLLPLYLLALRVVLREPSGARRNLLAAVVLASWVLVANLIPFAALLAHSPWRLLQAYVFFGALPLLGLLLAAPARAGRPAGSAI